MTKDERFLIEIYKLVGDSDQTIAPSSLVEELGMRPKLAKNILQGLMRANLVKKYGDDEVALTDRGRQLAQELTR